MASKLALRIMKTARAGDALSQFQLGLIHLDGGEGFAANPRVAYPWLARAAAQGLKDAWMAIGQRIAPEDALGDPELLQWYELAASDGCPVAALRIAQALMANRSHDYVDQACHWLKQAANGGLGAASQELGRIRLARANSGEGAREAIELLEAAWQQGERGAARLLADHYWKACLLPEAALWYERSPEPHDAEVWYRRGMIAMLQDQSGVEYLHRAATEGHLAACEELGISYAVGLASAHGWRRNLKQAVRWLEAAASGGSTRASYLLAMVLQHPTSAQRDLRRSQQWMFRAARNGHPVACLNAGTVLVRDIAAGRQKAAPEMGGEDIDVLAVRFLHFAERHGIAAASRYLSRLASRVVFPSGEDLARWQLFVETIAETDRDLAERVRLGMAMGLSARELVALDPLCADRGDCFVVDMKVWREQYQRRIVLIDSAAQRETIDCTKQILLRNQSPGARETSSAAVLSRYRWLRRACLRFDAPCISHSLFPRADLYAAQRKPGREPAL